MSKFNRPEQNNNLAKNFNDNANLMNSVLSRIQNIDVFLY